MSDPQQIELAVSRAPRFEAIDGFRAVCALYVVISHIVFTIYNGELPNTTYGYILQFLRAGEPGVIAFLVASGFCLTIPVVSKGFELSRGVVDFYFRRARRILPPYFVALILSLALAMWPLSQKTGTHWDVAIPVTPFGVISHVLMLQDLFPSTFGQINHVMWSISLEWRIYFLFPVILYFWRKSNRVAVAATVIVASLILAVASQHLRQFTIYIGAPYLAYFMIGVAACSICFSNREVGAKVGRMGISIAVIGFLFWMLYQFWIMPHITHRAQWIGGLTFAVFAAWALIRTTQPGTTTEKMLSRKPIVYVGKMSYSLYLVHAPIIQIVWLLTLRHSALTGTLQLVVLTVLSVPASLIASHFFYKAFEEPFTKPKKSMSPLQVRLTNLFAKSQPE